jgi:GNAT superfamily N-acetyltransferase
MSEAEMTTNIGNTGTRIAAVGHTTRMLSTSDFDAAVTLQRNVATSVPAGYVRLKDERELLAYLNGEVGVAFGIFDDDVLLATALVRIPSPEHPNAPEMLPRVLPASDWPQHTAILENALVAPRARGGGYQRLLLASRIEYAKAVGMRWIGGGSRFENIFSWRNMLAFGMTIVGVRVHEGNAYMGLLKPIEQNDALPVSAKDLRLVPTQHAKEHIRALDANYVGTRLTSFGCVVYQRYTER